jgi:hypothetical protein
MPTSTSNTVPLSTLLVGQFFNGLGWTILVGNVLIIYGYFVSNKKTLWAVLLCFALSGIIYFSVSIADFMQE